MVRVDGGLSHDVLDQLELEVGVAGQLGRGDSLACYV